MKRIVKLYVEKPNQKIALFKHKFKLLNWMQQIRDYEEYVNKGGSNHEKL